MTILCEEDWRERIRRHEERVEGFVSSRLERASRHERHPVEDFLFEYYSYRPAQLRRWHPGVGVVLAGPGAEEFLARKDYARLPEGVAVAPVADTRRVAFTWIRDLLVRTAERSPNFGCHGLHEWAMVYRSDEIRHAAWPLRLGADELAAFVESHGVRCSHYDAFRFFTPAARPLNRLQPTRETTPDFEQPGCLHANMDLYKWAYKLAPFTPSELVADAFELARDIRELDMRASPYDLRAIGREPVRIETEAGRAEYEREQRGFAARAVPLRKKLVGVCNAVLGAARGVLAFAALALAMSSCATKPVPEDGEPLVSAMSQRLAMAAPVAWTKQANGWAVRDPAREQSVIDRAVNRAEMSGLDGPAVAAFLRAQIDASCLEQERWIRRWSAGEPTPPGEPPTIDELRRRIDSITARMIAEWAGVLSNLPRSAVRARLVADGFSPAAASAASRTFSGR